MDKAAGDPLVGTTVAHYHVEAKLGGGGMGIVYAARDTTLGRRVALKFLPPQWSHDESAKQRFIREAQAASATDHPNICTIHDIGTAGDGQLFIVMAHYDGQTLKQRLEAGPLSVDEAVDIAAQVAEGLTKAHAQGVVHRDIKPGNLMLTENGVKILDFGLAKFADARLKLTLEGSTLGTIAYMSPEQARGEEADARSDVWAAGVVLYEMLTGAVPFKGGYPEAIAHAIRNDSPALIRASVPEVSEGLEQLVFRALHKEPDVRFQTARGLARALRLLQGRTLPLDLRTEQLPAGIVNDPDAGRTSTGRGRRWGTRAGLSAAALLALMGALLWVLSPIERIPVAVAPVVNQTGYAELDSYRLALTQEVVSQLSDSPVIRALPYDRLLQVVRRFRRGDGDVSSREAMQAIAMHGGARTIIVPTLVNENGGWRARVEFRNAETATTEAAYETPLVASSLMKDTVYGLTTTLAAGIEQHFLAAAPGRTYIARMIRAMARPALPPAGTRLRSLDAAAAFEEGLDAYEQQEHAAAFESFSMAAQIDARHPLPLAWKGRAARMMRRDDEMIEAAQAAVRMLTEQTPRSERLFVEAIAAESRRDLDAAESHYRELEALAPDEPEWVIELAGFQDRQGRPADAIATHLRALALDSRLVRPRLELCRLYNPSELATAKTHGEQALAAYRTLGARAGEAQALWCLADARRLGSEMEVRQARQDADAALKIFEELQYPYNLSRAYNYVALAALSQARLTEAVSLWEKALQAARDVGNAGLEPLALMNLGVMQVRLGNRSLAVNYYQQSARGFEALGQEQRAAELQANAANILIENGGNPEQGLRDLQTALAVTRKLGNRNFEVFAAQLTAAYHRYAGRHGDAERELNRAMAIARERDFQNVAQASLASLTTDLARSRLDVSDYEGARKLLTETVSLPAGTARTHARIRLGQTHVRLGDFESARRELIRAEDDLRGGADPELVPVLAAAMGELAYESGQPREARVHFSRAAALWTDTLPDAASVEARAYLGLIEALEGSPQRGRRDVVASLEQAHRMGRVSLEALCRLFLARIDIGRRRSEEALQTLAEIPADDESRTIGRELRAETHYWRGQALAGRGDRVGAETEYEAARTLIEQLRSQLANADRPRFAARAAIRRIIG